MKLKLIVSILIICFGIFGVFGKNELRLFGDPFEPQYFGQILDHFRGADTRTFKQKYYVDSTYWTPGNPIFLYINGEGPISGPPQNAVNQIYAKHFGALVVTLEHRFYGESQPFELLSTENLQYLSFKQALADLALFINFIRTETQVNKVVTFGCSYSGALSAWFRLKYPQMTLGSVASSGVVNAILDFYQFDEQVAISAGIKCSNQLRKITKIVNQMLANSTQNAIVQQMFQAKGLDNGDFNYLIANIGAESVQYGYGPHMCAILNSTSDENLLSSFANYATSYFYPRFGGSNGYSYQSLLNESVSNVNAAGRAWWYQKCTQLAYFQTVPSVDPIRSTDLTLPYFRQFCERVFGTALWPNTYETNVMFGGTDLQGTNIFLINSSQDPWQRASILTAPNSEENTAYVVCSNCGHCSDLRGCPSLPPHPPVVGCDNMDNVNLVRNQTISIVAKWLQQ